ncbi:class I SAM-dependent methyltransferase [Pinibacter aurantiacus]|uniref:Methyltransferase domain-containing protein n=1 Tax=Pinibacter aurantiacus TaxID=2851599 RepID=A0A9E2SCW8_9BACT|nr:class I SAM-dependent methyltransferase [Pinibacter aurantiacus]MBV4360341.1 methyltransferase domain-containing protein [Pinibacter aurantiacus]
MKPIEAYKFWSEQYDSNENKTRDLEAVALREMLAGIAFERCLEIGCGTGKNTTWFVEKADQVTSVDISEEMLAKAKDKIRSAKVNFRQADITAPWNFADGYYDLVSFSLVLEHIQNLDHIFSEAAKVLKNGGYVYVGELHPFKQYSGSKARFETENGTQTVECFNHNVSEFTQTAARHGFSVLSLNEYFDDNDVQTLPRILSIVFKKTGRLSLHD